MQEKFNLVTSYTRHTKATVLEAGCLVAIHYTQAGSKLLCF